MQANQTNSNIANVRATKAEFVDSVFELSKLPRSLLPEIAFIGRSNVGKSSLINLLAQHKSLCRTGKTPGLTKSINFFKIEFKFSLFSEDEESLKNQGDIKAGTNQQDGTSQIETNKIEEFGTAFCHFVDLPGFGYAKVSGKIKTMWSDLIEDYLNYSNNLKVLVLLVDSRRKLEEEEEYLLKKYAKKGLNLVITKADKLNNSEIADSRRTLVKAYEKNLDLKDKCFFTSSLYPNKYDLGKLKTKIIDTLLEG